MISVKSCQNEHCAFGLSLQGIGNTFQGAANCIMFVLFTKPIRTRLSTLLCCCCCCSKRCAASHSHDPSNRLLLGRDTATQRDTDSNCQSRVDNDDP